MYHGRIRQQDISGLVSLRKYPNLVEFDVYTVVLLDPSENQWCIQEFPSTDTPLLMQCGLLGYSSQCLFVCLSFFLSFFQQTC